MHIRRCYLFIITDHALMTVTISTTTLLFVFRVTAIYERNNHVTTFFGLMWLVIVGCSIITTKGLEVYPDYDTDRSMWFCITRRVSSYLVLDFIVPLVHDTLIFLAISWRLAKNSIQHLDMRCGIQAMILGKYMPAFSRSLLQDGQIYHL